ncbi:MAG: TetR/AcrR family transcriptional regulator [Bacteroidetes bacterium]|nr:TetR/AcrR family transcriptional regulator [Bacteroidota bacterium]
MPKDTFHKLPPEKQKTIVNAFIDEFSNHRYDDASITRVVKHLGIAKGSIYQYFKDKLDLYLYIKQACEQEKLRYIQDVKRDDFQDFWMYYRALYQSGVQFDLKSPRESKCLYSISKNEHSPSVAQFHNQWRDQALVLFEAMIQREIDQGYFRHDLSTKTMSFFMVATSVHIGDYMQIFHGTDFDKNIEEGRPVFAEQEQLLLQSVDQFIALMKAAFQPQNETNQ